MTSKKSFWVNIKTNARRRVWLAVVMFLAFFFSMPVFTALSLSTEKIYITARQTDIYLGRVFARQIGFSGGRSIFIGLLAAVAAIQGFSYMYQRKKLDMYMSVPVTKGKRFAAVYLNGFVIYFLSYLINLLLSFVAAQAMGANVAIAVGEACAALVADAILYLAVYNIAILAVMLTGNLIVTVMGTIVLLFYDGLAYSLLVGYMSVFFRSFFYRTGERMSKWMFSPIVRFIRLEETIYGESVYNVGRTLDWGLLAAGLVPIALVGAVAFGLAYWCYTMKPAEVCGRAMAFPKTKAVIKIAVTVLAGLGGGLMFYGLSGSSHAFFVFGILAGVLLCHGIIEVIYDFDIRSMKNGWKSLLISGGCVGIIACSFVFDVFGYDSYVPDVDQVEDIAVGFDGYQEYYDEDLSSVGREDYIFDNMHITNTLPVLQLATAGMANWDIMQETEDVSYQYMTIRYHLTNGKDVYRQFPVAYREEAALLDSIVTDPAYQIGNYNIYNEPLVNLGDRLHIYYDSGSGGRGNVSFTMAELEKAYKEDLKRFTFTEKLEQLVCGKIRMEYIDKGVYVYASLPVYPSFTQTIALLEKSGVYEDRYVNPDNIEQIIVQNNNSEFYDMYVEEDEFGNKYTYSNFTVEESFVDREEIETIIGSLYPESFMDFWVPDGVLDYEYTVTVVYKSSQSDGESYASTFRMLKDKIPDFVKERTTYKGDGEPTNTSWTDNAKRVWY